MMLKLDKKPEVTASLCVPQVTVLISKNYSIGEFWETSTSPRQMQTCLSFIFYKDTVVKRRIAVDLVGGPRPNNLVIMRTNTGDNLIRFILN